MVCPLLIRWKNIKFWLDEPLKSRWSCKHGPWKKILLWMMCSGPPTRHLDFAYGVPYILPNSETYRFFYLYRVYSWSPFPKLRMSSANYYANFRPLWFCLWCFSLRPDRPSPGHRNRGGGRPKTAPLKCQKMVAFNVVLSILSSIVACCGRCFRCGGLPSVGLPY